MNDSELERLFGISEMPEKEKRNVVENCLVVLDLMDLHKVYRLAYDWNILRLKNEFIRTKARSNYAKYFHETNIEALKQRIDSMKYNTGKMNIILNRLNRYFGE